MAKRRVWLGQIILDKEPPINLFAELPLETVAKKAAYLKERLAFLLDIRFSGAPPESQRLTFEEVAQTLHCSGRTVLRMIERDRLHPLEENGEIYFERFEIEHVRHFPISLILPRLISRT
jgi:hypothetical protein